MKLFGFKLEKDEPNREIYDILKRIQRCGKNDPRAGDAIGMLAYVSEELGETYNAVNAAAKGKTLDESLESELVDVALSALGVLYSLGVDTEYIERTMKEKLPKWERRVNG